MKACLTAFLSVPKSNDGNELRYRHVVQVTNPIEYTPHQKHTAAFDLIVLTFKIYKITYGVWNNIFQSIDVILK